MKKKYLVLLMAAMVGAISLTGCGTKKIENNKNEKTVEASKDANNDNKANAGASSEDSEKEMVSKKQEKERKEQDLLSAECIDSAFNTTLALEECYLEVINSSARELVFKDANSVKKASEKIGKEFAKELSYILSSLAAPKSEGAAEYVVTWEITDEGNITNIKSQVRLKDGTYLSNELDEEEKELMDIFSGGLVGNVDKSKKATDIMMANTIRSCFNAATCVEDIYEVVINSPVRELVLTDINSVNATSEILGEEFANEFSAALADELKAPQSKGAKEYVLTWNVTEDKMLTNIECQVRLEDGTFLPDEEE